MTDNQLNRRPDNYLVWAILTTILCCLPFGVVSIVFARLRWPKVIGFLLAGILLGEHTWGGSLLSDPKSINTIGQLGIVFLMFTLGLEFSAGEMKKVKHVTIPTAVFDSIMMIWLGYTVGRNLLGWNSVQSLFLGAAICDSATTLLAKTIEEMKWSSRPFVRYIFGTTIFEDILCVGVIALVTGVAKGNGMNAGDVGFSLGGLFVFLIGVIVFGLLFVPRLLNRVAQMKDDEALLLALLTAGGTLLSCGSAEAAPDRVKPRAVRAAMRAARRPEGRCNFISVRRVLRTGARCAGRILYSTPAG